MKTKIFLGVLVATLLTALLAIASSALTEGLFDYTIENGEATITGSADTLSGAVEIPTELGGCAVTKIGENAFMYRSNMTSCSIPSTVTYIGTYAFSDCTGLLEINLPTSVATVDQFAFYGCDAVQTVTVPATVTQIGMGAFAGCVSLTEISVDSENPNYCSVDGVLFNKDKTSLDCYPAGKTAETYAIPAEVTSISSSAFSDCVSLTSIVIPDTVKTVMWFVFYNCTSLRSVTFYSGITYMGEHIFDGCTDVTVQCAQNSVADTYAAANSLSIARLGDINADGTVTVADAIMLLHAILNGQTVGNAEMNGDGQQNLLDVLRIMKSV